MRWPARRPAPPVIITVTAAPEPGSDLAYATTERRRYWGEVARALLRDHPDYSTREVLDAYLGRVLAP